MNLGGLSISGYLLLDGVQPQSRLMSPDHMNESCAKGQKILRPSTLEEVGYGVVLVWMCACTDAVQILDKLGLKKWFRLVLK